MGLINKRDSYLKELARFGSKLGLQRIEGLLKYLGNPQERVPTVHIAGSNGKGSTAAMVAAILTAAGYRVGLYTSPHLSSYTERFQINGREISTAALTELLTEIRGSVADVAGKEGLEQPTEFEVLTAAALKYFREKGVDLAVMEVGLGGRLDATNVITPLVSVITHIALEHTDILGPSLLEVAREKAGIIKEGVPVVSSRQDPEVVEIIAEISRLRGAELTLVGRDIHSGEVSLDAAGILTNPMGRNWHYENLRVSLLGAHQAENTATALGAIDVLRKKGFLLEEESIRTALGQLTWPARMELVAGEPAFLLDVGHNPDGARALREAIKSHFPDRDLIMVFGALADKDVEAMAAILGPLCRLVILTRPNSPRALEPRNLQTLFQNFAPGVLLAEKIPAALKLAAEHAGPTDMVLVCGSFYMVGAAREYIRQGVV